tara:strand:+ start:30 stop:341 length:312 start_codon:yes stop_codon:yes gene_type:complete
LTLNKKQLKFSVKKRWYLFFLLIFQNFLVNYQSFSQEDFNLNEFEINRNINLDDEDNLDLPTNPFEIIDRIRRANSMNDATKPSDAIDEAIKSFDMIKEEKQI